MNDIKSFVLWFTGLSGAGKTTLAQKVFEVLYGRGLPVERLDGDVLRGIFTATGFTKEERDNHIKRVGFMSSLLEKHGVIVIASFISPYIETRNFVRGMCGSFIEVYVKASLAECERRDVKGLYHKARAGEITHFTGIDDPYEEPVEPELVIDTETQTIDESVEAIINYIDGYIQGI